MKSKLLQEDPKTYALIFNPGDELLDELRTFAADEHLTASHFTAIGAFEHALLGYFDRDRKDYEKIPVQEQVEVLSLVGDIAQKDDEPKLHIHAVLGRRDGSTCGGHLLEAHVWPTLELILTETPSHLRRVYDPMTGLALIDLRA